MSQATVIRASDLQAMTRRALAGAGAAVLADTARASSRKVLSSTRAAKWGNTLSGQRKAKLKARADRIAAKEAAAVEQDTEEERIRNAQRVETLRAARLALLSQTAQRKVLAGQDYATDMVKVREKQMALKKRRAEMEKAADAAYHAEVMARVKAAEEREADAAALKAQHKAEIAADLAEQVREAQAARLHAMQEVAAEGARLRAEAEAFNAAQIVKEKQRVAEGRVRNAQQQAANAAIAASRVSAKDIEREEERYYAGVAAEKERQDKRRADFVEMKRREAARRADHIGKVVADRFAAQMSDEAARLASQQEAAAARTAAVEEAKAEVKSALDAATHASRQSQLRRKAEAKRIEAEQRAAQARAWQAKVSELESEDRGHVDSARRAARKVAAYQGAQMVAKQMAFAREGGHRRDAEGKAAVTNLAGDDEVEVAKRAVLEKRRGAKVSAVAAERQFARSMRDPLIAADAYM